MRDVYYALVEVLQRELALDAVHRTSKRRRRKFSNAIPSVMREFIIGALIAYVSYVCYPRHNVHWNTAQVESSKFSGPPMRVLMPLPDIGFDPTEAAVAWKVLTDAGHVVYFASETGSPPLGDPHMLRGVLGGFLMGTKSSELDLYSEMTRSSAYANAMQWKDAEMDIHSFDALYLSGGSSPWLRCHVQQPCHSSHCIILHEG